jgi:hypothetical protein
MDPKQIAKVLRQLRYSPLKEDERVMRQNADTAFRIMARKTQEEDEARRSIRPRPKPTDIGASIDTTRPILDNPDGSFSTERTITIEADGKYFNIPTIVGGRQQSQEDAIRLWRSGDNKEVGSFNTLEDAVSTAQRRSSEIGIVRGGSR